MDFDSSERDLSDGLAHREAADDYFGAGEPHDEDFPLDPEDEREEDE